MHIRLSGDIEITEYAVSSASLIVHPHRRYPHKSGTFPDAVHRGFVIALELCGLLGFRFVEDTPGSGKPCMGCIFVYLSLFVWVVTLKANVDK
jgi:hypothetical protein